MVAFSKLISKIEEKALKLPNHLGGKRPAVADGQPRPIVFKCAIVWGVAVVRFTFDSRFNLLTY